MNKYQNKKIVKYQAKNYFPPKKSNTTYYTSQYKLKIIIT